MDLMTQFPIDGPAESGLHLRGVQLLLEAVQDLSMARDLASVQQIVRSVARNLTGCDGATFVLRDGDNCHYADENAIAPLWKGRRFPQELCISGWVMINRKPAVIADIYADPRIPQEAYRPTFVKSLAMVPIRTKDPVGAIGNYWATHHEPTASELWLLQALANMTSVAMENVQVYSELERRVQKRTEELQAAEYEARDARERLAAVLDSTIDGIVALHPSGRIETANAAAVRMLGYSREELEGQDVSAVLEICDVDSRSLLTRLGASEEDLASGLVLELNARRRDELRFPVDVALGAMDLPTGTHVVAVMRDASERRRIEQAKKDFIANVTHELRTPLTSIVGSLGLLTAGVAGELPEKASKLIAIATTSGQRLSRLVNEILDVASIESGQLTISPENIDLRDVARRSAEGIQGYADQLGVRLILKEGPSAVVHGDADRLIQVVTNLLSNACKFAPRDSEVTLSVTCDGQQARLSVKDNGPGIPDKFLPQIFSRFARSDAPALASKGGTGLGLVIAREISELHGGRLWFESEYGHGAIFHLELPLSSGRSLNSGSESRNGLEFAA